MEPTKVVSVVRKVAGPREAVPLAGMALEMQFVALDLLDDNPFQPRATVDEAKLEELAQSIEQVGLLQPINVTPAANGRFAIVAGHRRVQALRRLRDSAEMTEQRARFEKIRAQVLAGINDSQMAISAYVENVQRDNLNAVEEAAAMVKIRELLGVESTKELAEKTGQNERRVKRLLQVHDAPLVVKAGITNGLMISVSEDGKDRKELRHLDLMTGIAFSRLHDALLKRKGKGVATDRTETSIRRALSEGWGKRRIEEYVDQAINGRPNSEDDAEAQDLPADDAVFEREPRRFIIHLPKLRAATQSQRDSLMKAVAELIVAANP